MTWKFHVFFFSYLPLILEFFPFYFSIASIPHYSLLFFIHWTFFLYIQQIVLYLNIILIFKGYAFASVMDSIASMYLRDWSAWYF